MNIGSDRAGSAISRKSERKSAGFFRSRFVEPLVSSRNPPWFDARGIAFGLAIGFGVPVGAQMVCLGIVRLLIRFNTLVAFAFTWVNNPFTLIPMYYGYYYLGSLILGRSEVMTLEGFHQLMHPITQAGYFWQSLGAFGRLGGDIVLRWATAALIVAVVSGTLGYVMGYLVQTRRCTRRARRLGISYEKLVADLEKSLEKKG
ncbi:MAG: DUF2062 domain-containing protein [Desulfomonile tiedjei]|nr:DUF2062 domain-containing protein [Desulfomonile tiedjei]